MKKQIHTKKIKIKINKPKKKQKTKQNNKNVQSLKTQMIMIEYVC